MAGGGVRCDAAAAAAQDGKVRSLRNYGEVRISSVGKQPFDIVDYDGLWDM